MDAIRVGVTWYEASHLTSLDVTSPPSALRAVTYKPLARPHYIPEHNHKVCPRLRHPRSFRYLPSSHASHQAIVQLIAMPPVPIYASSPITAAKASGVTPQTAGSDSAAAKSSGPAPTPTTPQAYPAAQPGATPRLPKQTGAPSASYLPPTQTQNPSAGPPAPQPGAVPSASGLPPPPKTGEAYHPPQQTPAPQATIPYPPQMSIPPPTTSYAASYGASTATTTAPGYPQPPGPTPLPFGNDNDRLAHPPGYQQNAGAADFSSNQRAAHAASVRENGPLDGSEEGVWEAAKKWASTAGGNLAAAETEIWRRINKN
ncbi:hypothetical protein VDGL01_03819 [Verticillium dahliae]